MKVIKLEAKCRDGLEKSDQFTLLRKEWDMSWKV